LNWFKGGVTRELVLAEHPNRAIMARVSAAPEISVLPFEKTIEMEVGGVVFTTSTTLYKGNISLEFISDTPFWYARQNLLYYDTTNNIGIFAGAKLSENEELLKEAIKIIYEDRIPFSSMITRTMHFGADSYASIGTDLVYCQTAGPINASDPTAEPSNWSELSTRAGYFMEDDEYWKGARIEAEDALVAIGRIAGAALVPENA